MTVEVRRFQAGDEPGIRAVMVACLETDGIPGFIAEDIDRAMIRIPPDPTGTVVALEDGQVVGYCTPRADDLTVLPSRRRRGHGRRLVAASLASERDRGQVELQLYVPPHLPASVAFAEAVGLRYRSSMWQFRLPAVHPVLGPAFPADVAVRAWDPAADGDFVAWSDFMTAAFEGHPTPMRWTPELVRAVHDSTGFDPTDLLVAVEAAAPDKRIAFARIEVFGRDRPFGQRLGQVGLIGVLPDWRRRGLGRELLRWCLASLRERGVGDIELSVEAQNDRATALYRAHGFEPAIEWPHWVLPVDRPTRRLARRSPGERTGA